MAVKQISTHIHQITQYRMMNCFLVQEDDGLTLIDTLMSGSDSRILSAAQALNKPIVRIALTHAHIDHAGSVDALHAALPNAEALYPAREARFLAGDMSLAPDEPQSKLRGGYVKTTTTPTRTLEPGDRVGSLEVIAAPGHTPGHIAFLDTRDRTLIAGDAWQTLGGVAVCGQIKPLFPLPAMATWHKLTNLQTARALRALEPAVLAVGHGPARKNPLPEMDRAISQAAARWEA